MSGHPAVDIVLGGFLGTERPVAVTALGNHGGFSGARLWKVEIGDGAWCLRAWPGGTSAARLDSVHASMRLACGQGLAFVPRVRSAPGGATAVVHGGTVWDLTRWMPGVADFAAQPTAARLEAACLALAQVHEAWAGEINHGPCPALERRWRHWRRWCDAVDAGWRPLPEYCVSLTLTDLVRRAALVVPRLVVVVPAMLTAVQGSVALQPCLRDVWHDHLLFTGDKLTGLIDYGSVAPDHVAADLARLLGSLVADDGAMLDRGLRAYRAVRPLTAEEERLVRVLDRTGAVLAGTNWLLALCHERRTWLDWEAVARRFATVLRRLETWPA